MPRIERELVEVVLGCLDLAVVADVVAEPDERILDLAPGLSDRVQLAERLPRARERDVDDFLGQGAVELGAGELRLAARHGLLDRLAGSVQGHTGLAVADLA